jgi:DNA polymerase-3 subunit alpha
MQLKLDVLHGLKPFAELALLLARQRGKGRSAGKVDRRSGREPLVRLGKNFKLDGDLIERLIPIEGLANVALTARRGKVSAAGRITKSWREM